MKLSQKIVEERKKRGWSQEELAFRLNVSRQAVGKWESDLALPEVDKIVQMSKLFGVSCDYLLSDENSQTTVSDKTVAIVRMESESPLPQNAIESTQAAQSGNRLSDEQFAVIADIVSKTSVVRAVATALCVLSPVLLIVLAGLSVYGGLNENLAVGVGIGALLVTVAVAVVMFVLSGKNSVADYNPDEHSKGVLLAQLSRRKGLFVTITAVASGLCVLSAVPLLVVVLLNAESLVMPMVGVLLGIIAVAVFMYVYVETYKKMYFSACGQTDGNADNKSVWGKIQNLYWLVIVAAYLAWSFVSGGWGYTWIIWPVAAVLSAAIGIILDICGIKRDDD